MNKTNKILIILFITLFAINLNYGQEKRAYKRGYSKELAQTFSTFQKDLLSKEMKLWKRHHEALKTSLSDSQEEIVNDNSMSKRQRHEKIIISLDKNQKEMVKKFEQRTDTIRKKFYESLNI